MNLSKMCIYGHTYTPYSVFRSQTLMWYLGHKPCWTGSDPPQEILPAELRPVRQDPKTLIKVSANRR